MKSFISIIIPTYNAAKTLEKTLLSIVNQSFTYFEVLIMDGQSNDATLEIANKYQTKYPNKIYLHSQKDVGIYDAMNKGIEMAKGSWIYFIGSDDTLYETSTLETVFQTIEKSNAKVIYGNVRIIGDTGWAKDGSIYAGEFTVEKLLNQNICHQAIFYNAEFIKKEIGTYNLLYKKSSDWDYNLKCWAKQEFEYIDLVIANFYGGGFSTDSSDKPLVNDFVNNVTHYFKIDVFNKLLNTPKFIFYYEVIKKQKEKHFLRYSTHKFIKRVMKKLNRN